MIVDNRQAGGGGGAVDSVNGRTGAVVLTKSDVGLANVDNTSDVNKPVSTATQTALDLKLNSAEVISKSKYPLGDQTTTLDTPSDVTGMSFSVGANETWEFEIDLHNGCNNTGGIKYALLIPGGSVFIAQLIGSTTGFNTIAASRISVSDALSGVAYNTVNSTGGWVRISGSIQVGATPGTVQLRFASGVSTQTSTVYRSSRINARKVA